MTGSFLDLLYDQAPRAAFDDVVASAERAGASASELASCGTSKTSPPGCAS